MTDYKKAAKDSAAAKRRAMGLDASPGRQRQQAAIARLPPTNTDKPAGAMPHRRSGGRVEGEKARRRMDRKPRHADAAEDKKLIAKMVHQDDAQHGEKLTKFKRGGRVAHKEPKTSVNIVVAPSHPDQGAIPPHIAPVAAPIPAPAPAPAMPPRPGPAVPMPPPGMMRKRGGRVPHMTAGSGSGVGRLEKIGKEP